MITKPLLTLLLPGLLHAGLAKASLPGLLLTVRSDANEQSDTRMVRSANLHVPRGSAPSSLLPPGSFTATWRGSLNLEARSRLYFSVEGVGEVSLKINDEIVLEQRGTFTTNATDRLRLNPGEIPVEISYRSLAEGDARLRVFWQGRNFAREAIPPGVWTGEPNEAHSAQAAIRAGRQLFAAFNCIKCHLPDDRSFNPRTCMPELMEQGPSFLNIGHRLSKDWMREWLLDPHTLKSDARMPALPITPEEATDIAEYLSGIVAPSNPAQGLPNGEAKQGGQRFHALGCITCHPLGDETNSAPRTRAPVSLTLVSNKYPLGELSAFVKNPPLYHPGIRMPHFKLTQAESDQLELFLRAQFPATNLPAAPTGDPIRGAALVKSKGCLNCHQQSMDNQYKAPALRTIFAADWTKTGCVSATPTVKLTLDEDQRKALFALAAAGSSSLKQQNLAEYSERQLERLNCSGCHNRDGEEASRPALQEWSKHLQIAANEDAEHAPHKLGALPDLTYMAEKLNEAWMAKLFAGELKYRSRSWLEARMPAFPSRAALLAKGIAQAQGVVPTEEVAADASLAETGKQLMGLTGFTCISCHGNGTVKPIAVFEGQGINFAYIHERLTPEFYQRWMRHPQRINPTSIMPKYTDDEGRSALGDVFDGDATRQFDAIWETFRSIRSEDAVE